MPIRIIHCADLHLDSPLHGGKLPESFPRDLLSQAPRLAFEDLVRRAIADAVDLVLVAGDLFDDSDNDARTVLWLRDRFRELERAGVRVAIVHGNHDFDALGANFVRWPENVHVFPGDRASTWSFAKDGRTVAVHGRSFPSRHVAENLVPGFPAAVPGAFNIGLLHTSLAGTSGHDPYAPCSLSDLEAKSYGYWALGHVHARQTWKTRDGWAAYPGNLQGRDPGETGAKGFLRLDVTDSVSEPEFQPCDRLRWDAIEADVAGVASFDELDSRLRAHPALSSHAPLPEIVRVRLVGACALDAALRRRVPERDALLASILEPRGRHLESARVHTRPARDPDEMRAMDDLRAAVLQAIEELKGDSAASGTAWSEAKEEIAYHLGEWATPSLLDAPLTDDVWEEVAAQALASLEEAP